MNGNLTEVHRLLYQGADINSKDKYGNTPLIWASLYGHLHVVRILIGRGSDVDLPNNDKSTALMKASQEGHLKIVNELLVTNAKVDLKNKKGWTSLMYASDKEQLDIVRILLAYGADPTIQNNNGKSAADYAQKNTPLINVVNMYKQEQARKAILMLLVQVNEMMDESSYKSPINGPKITLFFYLLFQERAYFCESHHETIYSTINECPYSPQCEDHVSNSNQNDSGLDVESCSRHSLDCPICLEAFREDDHVAWSLRLTSCSHVFHSVCIQRWLASSYTCPCCRGDFQCPSDDLTLLETRKQGRFCTKYGLILPS